MSDAATLLQIHSDVARIKEQIDSLNERVDVVVDIAGQQAAIIRSFEDERQRRIGSQTMIKLLWGLISAGVASIAYNLHDIVSFFFPPKH